METKTYQSGMGKFSTQVAVASFAFGTLLLLLGMLFPKSDNILMTGVIYVVVAWTFNIMVMFGLAFCCIKVWAQRDYYGKKMLIVLANIPIAYLYFMIIIYVAKR